MDEKMLIELEHHGLKRFLEFGNTMKMDIFRSRISDIRFKSTTKASIRFIESIPVFQKIFKKIDEINDYHLHQMTDQESYDMQIYKIKPDGYKILESELRVLRKELQQEIKKMINVYKGMKKSGKIAIERPSPNIDSTRYREAERITKEIGKVQCIKKVLLFGSVAKGTDNEDSDIDLLLTYHGSKSECVETCETLIQQLKRESKHSLDVLSLSKFHADIDFYEPTIVMFESDTK